MEPVLLTKGRILYSSKEDAEAAVANFGRVLKHLNGGAGEVWYVTEDGDHKLLTVLD